MKNTGSTGSTIGNITNIIIDLKSPIPLKMDDSDVGKLMVIIGPNGSGKSLLMVLNWFTYTVINLKVLNPSLSESELLEQATAIASRSFDSSLEGELLVSFERGRLDLKFVSGTIIACNAQTDRNVTIPSSAIYFSKNTRTFEQVELYLKMRKMLETMGEKNPLEKLMETYKFYDVQFIEMLIQAALNGISLNRDIISMIESYGLKELESSCEKDKKISSLKLNKVGFYLQIGETEGKIYLSKISAGLQSILMMTVANLFR